MRARFPSQRVGDAGAKSTDHLSKQLARFRLLTGEADPKGGRGIEGLVAGAGSFGDPPVESMPGGVILEIRMTDSVGARIPQSHP